MALNTNNINSVTFDPEIHDFTPEFDRWFFPEILKGTVPVLMHYKKKYFHLFHELCTKEYFLWYTIIGQWSIQLSLLYIYLSEQFIFRLITFTPTIQSYDTNVLLLQLRIYEAWLQNFMLGDEFGRLEVRGCVAADLVLFFFFAIWIHASLVFFFLIEG